ncbi:MAG: hypothetical protein ACI8P3_000416 [Saprospiraceae bacterium]|jgi:hypothetical protein
MDKRNEHLEALSDIRSLMERSTRFISLSGLSGVSAGIFALLGAALVFYYFDGSPFEGGRYYAIDPQHYLWGIPPLKFMITVASGVFVLALVFASYFTFRKAKAKGQKIWDRTSLRLLINMALPLLAGGIFCIALIKNHEFALVAPATLVFYGLACINAAKYTLDEIRNLGIAEVVLGLFGMFYPGLGLELWALGFGILHITYGTLMYYKYDRV